MADYPELLFFDTFTHGSTQELNLDLVQFTKPVYLTEIRVIPLGARVQADFPGGVRLGATNPSEFSVEFFVNDLSSPSAATFQNLGTLQYNQNGPIHYECPSKQIPTDGLILLGLYTTVTLAVYGFITKTRPPPSNLVSQPNPPPAAETPPLRVISEHKTAEWVQQHAQVYHKESVPYDPKDLSYDEDPLDWSVETKEELSKSSWEKIEPLKEIAIIHEDKKSLRKSKRSPNKSPRKTSSHRHCSPENKDKLKEVTSEFRKHEERKSRSDRYHRSPSRSSKSYNELKKKSSSNNCKKKEHKSSVSVPPVVPPVESVVEKKCEYPVKSESAGTEKPIIIAPATLAPEDVEMVSEEEISEVEDEILSSPVCIQAVDEINEQPNERISPSAQEDSLDMDQFEPILSGSSDIESEEDIDIQDMEFDPIDLADEPNKIFNPYLFEIQPVLSMKTPYITDYEWESLLLKLLQQDKSNIDEIDKLNYFLLHIEQKPFEDGMDDWVSAVENVIPVIYKGFIGIDTKIETISRFSKLVDIGLDFDKAYHQPKPVFKLRHLKAGIRLAETLCRLDEETTMELIKNINLQHKLLDLYEKGYLALSMKLAILKTLDITLNYGNAVKSFVLAGQPCSGYRRLINLFYTTRTARVRYSLTNLLRKVHLYETLEMLYAASDTSINPMTEDVDMVVGYLEDVVKYLHEAATLISQPVRFLPIITRFEFPDTYTNAYFTVYSYFSHFHLLDILFSIMTSPIFITHPHILSCLLEILAEFLDSEHGLVFLASESGVSNRILKLLLNVDDQYSIPPQLGLHLAHRLYVLNLIDSFQYKWQVEQIADIDNTHLLEILSSVFYLTFSSVGKQSVTHVLSRGDMIKPFLKALQYSHNTGRERRNSPGKAYIADLVWTVVKGSDYVPFLERHARDLIEIASWQSDPGNSSWLNPVRNRDQCFSYNDITDLCDSLKKHTEKAITYPGELISALRILRFLAVPVQRSEENGELIELRYKFVLIQIFSQEGLTFLTSILNKICNHYERPHLQSHTLAGKEGISMMSLVTPALQLMRALLEYVIRCRDVEFKDLTALPVLIKTFALLQVVPLGSTIHGDAIEGCKEIIETLLAYTQTVAIESMCDTRCLNKSLWTSMMAEVLKFSVSVPEMFVPCLTLLSELLPLPLPVHTRLPLTESEILLVTNSRKLWSAHLLPLDNVLQEVISTLCWSSHSPLSHLLKRVCVQLADLGPPTALVVARGILSSLWLQLSNDDKYLSCLTSRLLGTLACLLTCPPLKMTVIQITTGSSKTDETFSEFWSNLLKHLSQPADGNVYHMQGQEFIGSLIQSLYDIEISLHPLPSQNVSWETYLANSLPPKNLFRSACEALISHLENSNHTLSTMSSVVRACTTLAEYDYGMFRLKMCLSEHSNALYNVLHKLQAEWSKENADCINLLTTLLGFFKSCSRVDEVQETNVNVRTLFISPAELTVFLKWNDEGATEEQHPLLNIVTLLNEYLGDEELFQSLKINVNLLIDSLNAAKRVDDSEVPVIETILDPSESLLMQFQTRPVFVVGDVEDERLSVAYWLSMVPLDELEQEEEQFPCNLEELANACIPTLQLETELGKLGHRANTHLDQTSKNLESNEQAEEMDNKPTQTVLVKPAKPRNFARPIIGAHRNDAFRSRIPNSSRAPSLHVDDFIALEKHQQQAAAGGYNRLAAKHQNVDLMTSTRNRNLSFLQDRNNHLHSPFRPVRGVMNSWHPLLATEPSGRTIVKTQPSVLRHPASAAPLLIRGTDLMRFGLSLSRWPTPPMRPHPVPQLRHHPPSHSTLHRHLRPPPSSFSTL